MLAALSSCSSPGPSPCPSVLSHKLPVCIALLSPLAFLQIGAWEHVWPLSSKQAERTLIYPEFDWPCLVSALEYSPMFALLIICRKSCRPSAQADSIQCHLSDRISEATRCWGRGRQSGWQCHVCPTLRTVSFIPKVRGRHRRLRRVLRWRMHHCSLWMQRRLGRWGTFSPGKENSHRKT